MSVKVTEMHLNEVVCFKAEANYTQVLFENGKKHISSSTLRLHENLVPSDQFVRLNRSYLVKKDFIEEVLEEQGSFFAKLKTGQRCRIPRRKKEEILPNILP